MGDRALLQVENAAGDVSPVLYLHWTGNNAMDIIQRIHDRMSGRRNDLDYTFARLVQQATENNTRNTGIGVWNQITRLTAEDSHGDNGCFIYNCSSGNTEHI